MSKLMEALSAKRLEQEITNCFNGAPIENVLVKNVIKYLHDIGLTGEARHIGSKKFSVTPEWAVYNPSKSLPKTDIIIGDKKISVKSDDRFQIIDANKNELTAMFYLVTNGTEIIKSRMSKNIIDLLQKFTYNVLIDGTVGKLRKKDPFIREADELHKEFQNQLEIMFANNPIFKREFIKEALTGNYKFGADSEASANHILIISPNELLFSPINEKIINMIANRTNVYVSFSSRNMRGLGFTGKYKYWTVVRMIVEYLFEKKLLYMSNRLNEKSVSHIKSIIDNLIKFFSSIENMLYFLDLQPEVKVQ